MKGLFDPLKRSKTHRVITTTLEVSVHKQLWKAAYGSGGQCPQEPMPFRAPGWVSENGANAWLETKFDLPPKPSVTRYFEDTYFV